MDINKCKKYR